MSSNENNSTNPGTSKGSTTPEAAAGQRGHDSMINVDPALSSDPGKASRRGAHVNASRNEDPSKRDSATDSEEGGLHPKRNQDANPGDYHNGDSTQAGTQNSQSTTRVSDSGAGSGNLTEENKANRTDKFGPDGKSETGI